MRQNSFRMRHSVLSTLHRWRPRVTERTPLEIIRILAESGITGLTCDSLAAAQEISLLTPSFFPLLLTQFPDSQDAASEVVELNRTGPVIVTIDHYRHAELYSAAACRQQMELSVLLLVDSGGQGPGVRPGHDTCRLGQAVDRLPGLRLSGLLTDDRHAMLISDPASQEEAIQNIEQVLRYSGQLLQKSGIQCPLICGGRSASVRRMVERSALTDVVAGSIIYGDNCEPMGNAIRVRTQVVSRPALVRAIVNGHFAMTEGFASSLRVVKPEGAVITSTDRHCAAMELSGDALELQIGDTVEIAVQPREIIPEIFQTARLIPE